MRFEGEGNRKQSTRLHFQVADVKKPLMAVKRICVKGNNTMQFGENEDECFIMSVKTRSKPKMRKRGMGLYVIDVNFLGGSALKLR